MCSKKKIFLLSYNHGTENRNGDDFFMKTNINENIKFYRKEKGFTQEQLAEAMGVSVGAVSNVTFPNILSTV